MSLARGVRGEEGRGGNNPDLSSFKARDRFGVTISPTGACGDGARGRGGGKRHVE